MSDESQQSEMVTFEQIAARAQVAQKSQVLWDKAHKILTHQPKILTSVDYGGSNYLASPEQVTKSGKNEIRYAVAALADKGNMTNTHYIVVNSMFDSLVEINPLDDKQPLTTFDAKVMKPVPVKLDNIENVLDELYSTTVSAARNYKSPAKRAFSKSVDFAEDFGAPVLAGAALIGVVTGIVFGVSSWTDWVNEDRTYAAAFDREHPDYVIEGTRIHRGEEVVLQNAPNDEGVYIPRATSSDVTNRARWTTVSNDSCSSATFVRPGGYLKPNDALIAHTSNSDDVVRVRVGEDGKIDYCAYAHDGDTVVLTLQTQPNEK